MTVNKLNSRKIQAEERRSQIMDTALKVFAEKGFSGTSIKDIAEAADISQGLMYHYFASKDALLKATIEYHSFLPELRHILSDKVNLPADQVLKEIANKFLDMLEAKKSLVKVLIRDVAFDPEISDAWADLCQEGVALMKKYIDSRISSGEFKPHNSEITARCMFSMVIMFHFTKDVFKESWIKRDEYINEILNNTMKGIGRDK
jgi:AcrR family transcriptional regulator